MKYLIYIMTLIIVFTMSVCSDDSDHAEYVEVFQNGVSPSSDYLGCIDSYIFQQLPAKNYGTETSFSIGSGLNYVDDEIYPLRAVLMFSLPSLYGLDINITKV